MVCKRDDVNDDDDEIMKNAIIINYRMRHIQLRFKSLPVDSKLCINKHFVIFRPHSACREYTVVQPHGTITIKRVAAFMPRFGRSEYVFFFLNGSKSSPSWQANGNEKVKREHTAWKDDRSLIAITCSQISAKGKPQQSRSDVGLVSKAHSTNSANALVLHSDIDKFSAAVTAKRWKFLGKDNFPQIAHCIKQTECL